MILKYYSKNIVKIKKDLEDITRTMHGVSRIDAVSYTHLVDAVISEDMLGSYDMNKMGIQSITVTRGGKSVDFNIEVKGIMPVSYTHLDVYKRQVL